MVTYTWQRNISMTVTDEEAKIIDRFREVGYGAVEMIYRGQDQKKWAKKQERKAALS